MAALRGLAESEQQSEEAPTLISFGRKWAASGPSSRVRLELGGSNRARRRRSAWPWIGLGLASGPATSAGANQSGGRLIGKRPKSVRGLFQLETARESRIWRQPADQRAAASMLKSICKRNIQRLTAASTAVTTTTPTSATTTTSRATTDRLVRKLT